LPRRNPFLWFNSGWRRKPQELRALWLCAQGHSYAEIAEITQWTATNVWCQIGPANQHLLTLES
jgi:hypothetical protein